MRARSFSSSDVARITQSINDVRARGDEIAYAKQRYHYDIQRYINDIIDRQTYIQLQDIPVSELNKDKSGIRVSALTSAGYNTVVSLVGLSPYQITAIKGIGDEMGLGKTIQAIATMVSLRNTGATHFLVVCPASVLSNWCREIKKMSTLFVTEIYGQNRVGLYQLWQQKGGVGVTTYETTEHIANIDDFWFDMCIVDEAHYIKNPEAQRTQNVKMLCAKSDKLLFMTGTALENRVEEMTSLIGILNPEVYNQIKNIHYISRAPQFRQIIAPVYYRRKREEVLSELPDKIEKIAWCKMNSYEEMMYESAVLNKDYTQARRVSWNVENLEQSSKANRLVELVKQAETFGDGEINDTTFGQIIEEEIERINNKN